MWLLAEIDPAEPNRPHGLCDLGLGSPELGYVSLKYERDFLNAFETGSAARGGIGSGIDYYNRRHPRSTLAGSAPDEVYAMAESTEAFRLRDVARNRAARYATRRRRSNPDPP